MLRAAAALVLVAAIGSAAPSGAVAQGVPTSTVPDQVVVGFAPGTTAAQRAEARASIGATRMRSIGDDGTQALAVPGAGNEQLEVLDRQPGVACAEPDYVTHADLTPPDSGFGLQWGLFNSGFTGGTFDADIDADRAWDLIGPGSPSVLVGLADSGIDPAHPGFTGLSVWNRPSSYTASANGNASYGGCVVDDHGCDAVTGGAKPFDENGHGTAVGGIVFGNWSASSTYAGVAPASTLIPAKVLDTTGSGTTAALAAGLDFLGDAGARVVNVSIGGPYSQAVHDAIASHPGTLFVASAGNAAVNVDQQPSFPCADPAPNVLCVAATDKNDQLASFSNYGAQSVDVAAPGQSIASLSLGGGTGSYSGTSFAAPMVTGIAALAFAAAPSASVATIKTNILWGVDGAPSLTGKVATGGRANAYNTIAHLLGVAVVPRAAVATPAASTTTTSGSAAQQQAASTPTPGHFGATTTKTSTIAIAGSVRLRASARLHGTKAIKIAVTCVSSGTCSGPLRTRATGTTTRKDYTLKLNSGATRTLTLPIRHATHIKHIELSTGSGSKVQSLLVPVRKR